jgi:hypothetical protein
MKDLRIAILHLALKPADFAANYALVLRPKHRDQEVTCGGSRYLIKQRAWSGGSGGRRGFQDCG